MMTKKYTREKIYTRKSKTRMRNKKITRKMKMNLRYLFPGGIGHDDKGGDGDDINKNNNHDNTNPPSFRIVYLDTIRTFPSSSSP